MIAKVEPNNYPPNLRVLRSFHKVGLFLLAFSFSGLPLIETLYCNYTPLAPEQWLAIKPRLLCTLQTAVVGRQAVRLVITLHTYINISAGFAVAINWHPQW